jgi:DNA helicase II / ATP-dependent DNA helicase PcrA
MVARVIAPGNLGRGRCDAGPPARPERPVVQPQEARNTVIDANAVSAHDPRARLFRRKFGYGTVTAVEGDKLTIDFEKAGPKNVVARFVTAADAVPF